MTEERLLAAAVRSLRAKQDAPSALLGVAWSAGPLRLDGAGVVSMVFVEGQGYTPNQQSSGISLGLSAGARLSWSLGRLAP